MGQYKGSSEGPYRTPVIRLPEEERKLEIEVGIIIVTLETPRFETKFVLEGSGPPEGVWFPTEERDSIYNHIIYSSRLLMNILERTHQLGFMYVPGTTYIVPEKQIRHINAEQRSKTLTYDIHKWGELK